VTPPSHHSIGCYCHNWRGRVVVEVVGYATRWTRWYSTRLEQWRTAYRTSPTSFCSPPTSPRTLFVVFWQSSELPSLAANIRWPERLSNMQNRWVLSAMRSDALDLAKFSQWLWLNASFTTKLVNLNWRDFVSFTEELQQLLVFGLHCLVSVSFNLTSLSLFILTHET